MATDSEPKGFASILAKIIGGISVAVIAPIVATVGGNYLQKKLDDPSPPAEKVAAPEKAGAPEKTAAPENASKSLASLSPAPTGPVVTPKRKRAAPSIAKPAPTTIHLFNGRNLENFQTFLGPRHNTKEPLGPNNDPDKVFTIRRIQANAKNPAHSLLVVSGQDVGVLETKEEYENYHLTVEYQWGENKWPPHENRFRLSGVGFHCQGPVEVGDGRRPGYRCFITDAKTTGDVGLHSAPAHQVTLTAEVSDQVAGKKGKKVNHHYSPGSPSEVLTNKMILHRMDKTEPVPKNAVAADTKWHTIQLDCAGDQISVAVDGTTVLRATKLSQTRGRIQLLSDGAEIFFRKLELRPLPPK